MPELKTKYMGFDLDNPIIAASSILTGSADKVKSIEDAGAGAVVLKSIFEEQIMAETDKMMDASSSSYHPEALDYISRASSQHTRDDYLALIRQCSENTDFPIIASLNCVSQANWIDFAKEIEEAGADGLELNMFVIPKDHKTGSESIEKIYSGIIKDVKSKVKIPIAAKISPYFTNLYAMADIFEAHEIASMVLFNRYYNYSIDIDKMELKHGKVTSTPDENGLTLRWIMLLAGRYELDLAATTGIHDGRDVVRQILAGANAVQVASTLYKNGVEKISEMKNEIIEWMGEKGFKSIEDFKGKLSQAKSADPQQFERFQYIKTLVGVE